MKLFPSVYSLKSIAGCALLAACCAPSVQAQVTPVTLTSGTSTAMVDVDSSLGMYHWDVSGQNQLNRQWFYYQVNGSGPSPVNAISAANWSQPTANSLNTVYNNGLYNVSIGYTLIGQSAGLADINEDISIQNTSGGTLTFTFFQYSDFNLGGTPGGDTVTMDNYDAFQQKGTTAIVEGIIDPAADHFEANTIGGPGSTLARLNGVSPVALLDFTSASGDVSWAYEWDLTLENGQTALILKDKALSVQLIPEPSSLAIAGVGLAAWAIRRRSARA
ncbi:MAG: PEP-CTERM sorting domain-containing protein [Verrucomicrobiota bacterium]